MQQNSADAAGPALANAGAHPPPPGAPAVVVTRADLFDHILNVQDPCEAVFQSFRKMRQVSSEFLNAVNTKQVNTAWLAPLVRRAAEFCDDLQPGEVLAEGAAPSAGLRRLLTARRYDDIANGMRQFAQDPVTQREILRLLQLNLSTLNDDHGNRHILASNTVEFNLHRALARTIRLHFANVDIVRSAVDILNMLTERDDLHNELLVGLPVCTYIVETMLEVMRVQGSLFAGFVRKCLYIIWTVTAYHVPQSVQGTVLIGVKIDKQRVTLRNVSRLFHTPSFSHCYAGSDEGPSTHRAPYLHSGDEA